MRDSDIHMDSCHHCDNDADTVIHGRPHCIACAILHHANEDSDA